MAPTLGGAAVWYAERGHLVFPLRPHTKIPATPHGFKDASMNPDTIRAWWTRWPDANIGLATGHLFDVIDIDGPTGIESATTIEDAGQLPAAIGTVATPRGYHHYIQPTGDGCTTAVRPGIDYRGIGGYVVAPPSLDQDGRIWRWLDPLSVCDADT
jgi:hypothetical protein